MYNPTLQSAFTVMKWTLLLRPGTENPNHMPKVFLKYNSPSAYSQTELYANIEQYSKFKSIAFEHQALKHLLLSSKADVHINKATIIQYINDNICVR